MPSTSNRQHNFMEAVAHSPGFAKKAGVPQSVGKDFAAADAHRKAKAAALRKGAKKKYPPDMEPNEGSPNKHTDKVPVAQTVD